MRPRPTNCSQYQPAYQQHITQLHTHREREYHCRGLPRRPPARLLACVCVRWKRGGRFIDLTLSRALSIRPRASVRPCCASAFGDLEPDHGTEPPACPNFGVPMPTPWLTTLALAPKHRFGAHSHESRFVFARRPRPPMHHKSCKLSCVISGALLFTTCLSAFHSETRWKKFQALNARRWYLNGRERRRGNLFCTRELRADHLYGPFWRCG